MGRRGVGFTLVGFAVLIAAVATSLFALAVSALPHHDPRAVQVEATVSHGGRIPCSDEANPVRLSFNWKGRSVQEPYYGGSDPCDETFVAGQNIKVFVDTDDPTNIGPTERWITHPDEHDPFDAGVGAWILLLAALWLGGLLIAIFVGWFGVRMVRRPGVPN